VPPPGKGHWRGRIKSQFADELLNEGFVGDFRFRAIDRPSGAAARLEDYESAGQIKADALQALLTFANADLMHIAYALGSVVKDSLADAPLTTENVRQVEPALNNLLRVTRQVSVFAQLEVSIEKARVQAEDTKCRARSAAMFDGTPQAPRWPR
jgi:hypothetical protein